MNKEKVHFFLYLTRKYLLRFALCMIFFGKFSLVVGLGMRHIGIEIQIARILQRYAYTGEKQAKTLSAKQANSDAVRSHLQHQSSASCLHLLRGKRRNKFNFPKFSTIARAAETMLSIARTPLATHPVQTHDKASQQKDKQVGVFQPATHSALIWG